MNEPEEQDRWTRLHPLTPLLRSLQVFYALILAGLFATLSEGPLIFILLGAALAGVLFNTLAFLFLRYRITDDSLVIIRGILFRKRRVIPLSRIENVDVRAGLVHQIVGVVVARIETAGGEASEATLNVVSRAEGDRLRQLLVTQVDATPALSAIQEASTERGPATETFVPGPAEVFERRLSLLDLAIAGMTSNRAGVLVGVLLGSDYAFQFMPTDWVLARFLPTELRQPQAAVESLYQAWQHDLGAFLTGLAVLSILFGLAGWGLSVLASVIRFFDFTLTRRGGELRVIYGLLTRREKGFRRARVQNVQVEESIIRRWFNLAALRVQTAGYGPGSKEAERMETLTPITRVSEISDYLHEVYPDLAWDDVEWRPSHPRSRRRLFIRRAAVVVLVSGGLALFLTPNALFLLIGLVPAWIMASLHYRHLGHARQGSYVLMREGFWNRRSYVVPIRKIQTLHLRQTPFQRRLGLATLTAETAGNPFDWHAPRSIDLGTGYGRTLLHELATEVSGTGLTF